MISTLIRMSTSGSSDGYVLITPASLRKIYWFSNTTVPTYLHACHGDWRLTTCLSLSILASQVLWPQVLRIDEFSETLLTIAAPLLITTHNVLQSEIETEVRVLLSLVTHTSNWFKYLNLRLWKPQSVITKVSPFTIAIAAPQIDSQTLRVEWCKSRSRSCFAWSNYCCSSSDKWGLSERWGRMCALVGGWFCCGAIALEGNYIGYKQN